MARVNWYKCSIEGCAKQRQCRGLCSMHYARLKTHGRTDIQVRHGESNRGAGRDGKPTPEYRAWSAIKLRCYYPRQRGYRWYGARGITMCDRWRYGEGGESGFECFLADMGRKPAPRLSIDRINPDGNYEPANCRWASATEQARNKSATKRIEFRGQLLSLPEICEPFGTSPDVVRQRLKAGYDLETAVTAKDLRRKHAPGYINSTPQCAAKHGERE